MKKWIFRFMTFCFAIVFLLSCSLVTSAKEYVKNIVEDEFSSSLDCSFLPPGDIDTNGKLDAADLTQLRRQLLKTAEVTVFSDVNGDDTINIIDLIRLKKNTLQIKEFVSDGSMILNGKSLCYSDNFSKLGTGASYAISYTYKSTTPIKVKVSGLGEEIVFESAVASERTTVTHNFKTPLNIKDSSQIALCVIGSGTIEEFNITRINIDNELIENW